MHLIHEKYKIEMCSNADSSMKENMEDSTDAFYQSSAERRKSSKPVMEKKRRARINASLLELKAILLEVMRKEGGRPANRMEKADILEMSVKHLRQIQRQQFTNAVSQDPSVLGKYAAGFNECATEVTRYLGSLESLDVEVRARLLNHLANTMQNLKSIPATANQNSNHILGGGQHANRTAQHANIIPNYAPMEPSANPLQVNVAVPNSNVQSSLGGVQLVPTRLPNGDMAFVIPQGMLNNANQVSNYVLPVYNNTNGMNTTMVTPTPAMNMHPMPMVQTPVMATMPHKTQPLEPRAVYSAPMALRLSPISPAESLSSKDTSPMSRSCDIMITPPNGLRINFDRNRDTGFSSPSNLPETPKSVMTTDTSPSSKSAASSFRSSPSGFTTSPTASSASGSPDRENQQTSADDNCWRPW